jgi:hypothetical protein
MLSPGRSFPWKIAATPPPYDRGEVMAVKCVFYISGVEKRASGVGVVNAQAAAKGPYKEWSQFTPSGSLQITSLNPQATDWFIERIGKDVTVLIDDATEADITPA